MLALVVSTAVKDQLSSDSQQRGAFAVKNDGAFVTWGSAGSRGDSDG